MTYNRREVLKLMALGGGLAVTPRWVFAGSSGAAGRDRLVSIFLRGGADGLTIVPPLGDPHYFDMRPQLSISEADALDLDGFFGLNPAAAGIKSLYDEGSLAVVHAAGLDTAERSHFSAQAAMEQGINPGDELTGSGWLGRYLSGISDHEPLASVALGTSVPQSMAGAPGALAFTGIENFRLGLDARAQQTLMDIYADDARLSDTAETVFATVDALAGFAGVPPGAGYPEGELGHALSETARLIKGGSGLLAAGLDLGGWDHHENQARYMPAVLGELSAALAAFRADIGAAWSDTAVVVQSEFGRCAHENASAGADHGHGGVMFVAGGAVNGGRVYADWPGLAMGDLSGGEDLDVSMDYRQVLSELLVQRLGVRSTATVFPEFSPRPWQGLFAPRA